MKETLLNDLKESMRNKEILRKDTVMMLRAAILQVEKDTQKELSEEEMSIIVAKEVKKRRDSIDDYIKGDRQDIADQINQEIEILSKYLPKQLTNEDINALVDEAIKELNITSQKEMGKVMQYLKPKISGKADGKVVSDIVKEKLGNM